MARASKLRLFESTVNRTFSPVDARLIAGVTVSVAIHRQGATAAETKTVTVAPVTLAIRDPGALRIGEIVQLNTITANTMQIVSIDSRTQVTIQSTTGGNISVASGDRLVPQTKPVTFNDVTGASTVTNPLTTNTLGYVSCYVYEQAVDYIISGLGITSLLIRDHRTGAIDLMFNVIEYGAVGDGVTDDEPALNRLSDQVALFAPDEGISTILYPRGVYFIKSPWVPDGENITGTIVGLAIRGEAGAKIKAATTAQGGSWTATGRTALLSFKNTSANNERWTIEGLELDGSSVGAIGGATALTGIYMSEVKGLTIRDCYLHDFGDPAAGSATAPRNDGIILGDDVSDTTSAPGRDVLIENCKFERCVRNGISLLDCVDIRIVDCKFDDIQNAGIDAEPNFAFQSMRNITIDRSKFFDCDIAGIVVIPGSGLTGSVRNDQFETLKIRGCDIDGNSVTDNGINIGNWIDVLIEGGTIQHTETGGILIRSCKDVKVRGVTVTDVTLAGTGATYGVQVDSTLTVNSAAISVHGCKISTIDGYGIHYIDTDTGSIVDNIIDDCDNDSQARDNIRVVQSTLVCRRVSVIGNVSTNSALGSGIRFHNSGVTDCIVSGNICLGNGAANQIADVGTNTHHGLNVTGSFSGHTTTNFMSVPNAGAPPGGGGSAWAGIFTAASAVATTLVSNNNIRSTNAIVHLTPRSLAAANNVSAWHITAISAGSFKLKHRATAGQVFLYSILNRG